MKMIETSVSDPISLGLIQMGEIADHGIIIVDKKGNVVYYNPWQAKLDQLDDPDTIMGKPVDKKGMITRQTSVLRQVLQTGNPVLNFEQHYMNFKNQYRKVHGCAHPIYHGAQLVGAMGIYRHAQAHLKVLNTIRTPETHQAHPPKNAKKGEDDLFCFTDILGEDIHFLNEISKAKIAANGDLPVLICGETGTGKELVAQSIHRASQFSKGLFVAVNCAAIPENLFESTLFGTRKNAFTGAVDKKGLMALAHKGTLFLDELNAMPFIHQSKLLRAIETGKIRPVGALEEVSIQVRLLSSCNADPGLAIKTGKMRSDLFYRLAGFVIQLPRLNQRKEDIILLAKAFMERANLRMGRMISGISVKMLQVLMGYDWPGNVRQLKHYIESNMGLLSPLDTMLTHHFLPDHFNFFSETFHGQNIDDMSASAKFTEASLGDASTEKRNAPSVFREIREQEEKDMIFALKQCNGNITKASQYLKISRRTFYYKMKKHGIKK